ncbi:MAG: class I SAM-dependent methyltransferase [bacterium]|nr:class I SAM-dependent methyltransferase [bacterium]
MFKPAPKTSWNKVAPWYNKIVGQDGHYYHEHVVLPGVIRLLALDKLSTLLDLGCGQGILARSVRPVTSYLGLDNAPSLIAAAKKSNTQPAYIFRAQDVTKVDSAATPTFTHAAIVLALQNMAEPEIALQNAAAYLKPRGKIVIVLNHPCFRIPRQSGWGVDDKTKQQYRWINRYRSALKIPILMNPGQQNSAVTWSFHRSLHDYSRMLQEVGLQLTMIEEWTSDKASVGKAAKMENRARDEFPLFMTLVAIKQ